MRRKERADRIREQLEALYGQPAIPLDHTDAFTLLVAVLLSAQTTDKKVNQITPALFDRAPTPAAMAALTVEEIRELIREVGLAPQKAKALKRTAELLVEVHDSVVPQAFEELEALPGVGHKTASVDDVSGLRISGLPSRYPHPQARDPLAPDERQKCGDDRGRPQAALPRGELEPAASADHLLWP